MYQVDQWKSQAYNCNVYISLFRDTTEMYAARGMRAILIRQITNVHLTTIMCTVQSNVLAVKNLDRIFDELLPFCWNFTHQLTIFPQTIVSGKHLSIFTCRFLEKHYYIEVFDHQKTLYSSKQHLSNKIFLTALLARTRSVWLLFLIRKGGTILWNYSIC